MNLNLTKLFNFKREFGIADFLALIAIVISAISLYQSNKALEPYLVLGYGDNKTGIIKNNETGKCMLITELPVVLNNSGQKSALIHMLSLPDNLPPSLYSLNDKMLESKDINHNLYLLQGHLPSIQDWEYVKSKYKPFDLNRPIIIKKIIPPNSSYTLNFILSSEVYTNHGKLADRMYVGLNIKDGDNKTYEMRMNMEIPDIGINGCK